MSSATMSTAKTEPSFFGELLSTEIYKRNQGRLVRQATFLVLAGAVLIGGYRMYSTVMSEVSWRTYAAAAFDVIGVWAVYRLVNYKVFADFLIAVESEMQKVSWPEWGYLYRATGVVFAVMVILGAYIWGVDFLWVLIFKAIHFLEVDA